MEDLLENEGIIVNEPTIPFTSDEEAHSQFWRFVLRNVDRFKDQKTIDEIHKSYFAWRLRSRDKRERVSQPMEVDEDDLI